MTGPTRNGRPQDRASGGRNSPPRRPGGGHPAGGNCLMIVGKWVLVLVWVFVMAVWAGVFPA